MLRGVGHRYGWMQVIAVAALSASWAINTQAADSSEPLASIAAARRIDVTGLAPTWRVAAGDPPSVPQWDHCSITLASGEDGRTPMIRGPWLSADGRRAFVCHVAGHRGAVQLETCDVVAGKSLGVAALPVLHSMSDVSPSGRFIAIAGRGGRKDHSVAVVSIEDFARPDVVARLRVPDPRMTDDASEIEWSAFIDDDHLLTFAAQRLVLWRWREAAAVYVVEPGPTATPRLDHDRRYVTWCTDTQTLVVDALGGGVKGVIDHGEPGASVRVSPDATRVAVMHDGHLTVLRGADGKRLAQIPYPSSGGDECWWLDNRFIFTRLGHVLDTDKGMVAWQFTDELHGVLRGSTAVAGQTLVLLPPHGDMGNKPELHVAPLQLDEVRAALEKLDPAQVFAVRPGVAVSLRVDIPDDPDAARRIAASLTQRLADNGVTVAPNQPVTLVARWKRDRPRTGDYAFGRGPFTQNLTATIARQHLSLAFELEGKPLWSRTTIVGSPGFIPLTNGQTPQQALGDLARPNYTFLEQCPLPPLISHARYANGLGSTTLAP